MGRLKTQPQDAHLDGSVVDWAMESHRFSKDYVYVLPEDRKRGEDYYEANAPVVDRQLAKAGVRLAIILNEALREEYAEAGGVSSGAELSMRRLL